MKQFISSIIFVLFLGISPFLPVQTSFADPAQSQASSSNSGDQVSAQEKEYFSTLTAALNAATTGPTTIPLFKQATLKLPENYLFVPKNEAADFMKAMGNSTASSFVGLIVPKDADLPWFITVDFIDSGYLKDGDAENWTADSLMKSLKEGNDEDNKNRISNGFPALEILGWVESPKYDSTSHTLIWSMLTQDQDSNTEPTINYNTYVLGREGYFKLDLVTSKSTIEQDKPIAKEILTSLSFLNGKRYEDFNKGTDRIAEYGLAALITGVAAKKLGLLALAFVFLIKVWKIAIVVALILWSWIKKILRIKAKKSNAEAN